MAHEFVTLKRETSAALAFVHNGPYTLDQLRVSRDDESFSSFDAFKKIEAVKRFGPAGEGLEYHHLVEQSGVDDFPTEQLQSTANIIRIPKLLHEEINSEFGQSDPETSMSLRANLEGKSFANHWNEGLRILRKIGIVDPGEEYAQRK